ncbi:exonuclease SbcCD subunit D C-terminal domain-containing protein [Hymenobacter sp. BT175]|uniref:exonuclease SbcCD subunit D C-terminal domain-containing protein n=1 Tax=Hymenobacter translucens TaxID=2886507 RepID=UPI001D0E8E0D|nr:exonuclease SbcCD subunit D C-terminal domain-containing protein [Hymenobacter translucens]MCC2548075.1 exonuclease SbcCD subunit D C-terminal domain-containing protein [Hymenobacter translucens]
MRVLHTADWHLGQRFQHGYDRLDEHRCFLDWLLETIEAEFVDVLVVAGDVFDTGNPPAAARKLYYQFLARLRASATCHDVVIVGGNHDSADTLNASATLLRELRVHVVGGVPGRFEDQCLTLPSDAAEPRLVVAAVPFLRDADVRHLISGESTEEREARLRNGIAAHYQRLADLLGHYREVGVPVLATGHLFAAGCGDNDASTERPLSIGALGQITADAFPACFDYVALGHLHRPQVVGQRPHIRYSGSPIPLSFSETDHPQQVMLLTFDGPGCPEVQALTVPCERRLVRFRGSLESVLEQLSTYDNTGFQHEAWAEVAVLPGLPWSEVQDRVREAWQNTSGQVRVVAGPRPLREQVEEAAAATPEAPAGPHLDELSPQLVFEQLLDAQALEPAAREQLLRTFDELLATQ